MCETIMKEVAGLLPEKTTGRARGYRRHAVIGEDYPAIIPDAPSRTEGVVYLDLPDSAWARLDKFEGEMYMRQPVTVEREDGTLLSAEAYVARPEFADRLDASSEWDFAEFQSAGKIRFQREYRGYRQLETND
jgi:hypothetical protein